MGEEEAYDEDADNRLSVGGRPPEYANTKELEDAIDGYFKGGMRKRKVLVGFGKDRHVEFIPVPTITGLALWLGFDSRQSFYDYEKRAEFSYTIKKARLFIEQEYEEMLSSNPNPAGAIFALKNFGWRDKSEVELSGELLTTREKLKELSDDPGGLQDDGELPDTGADSDSSGNPESI